MVELKQAMSNEEKEQWRIEQEAVDALFDT